jgi:tight adherence protein B
MAPLLLAATALLLSIALGVFAFRRAGVHRRLRSRVHAVVGISAPEGGDGELPVVELPSIRVARRSERPWLTGFLRLLRYYPEAAAAYPAAWWVVLTFAGILGVAAAMQLQWVIGLLPSCLAGMAIAALLSRAVFGWQFGRYRDALFRQIPDALALMVSTVRAGLPIAEALRSVSREMPSPTGEEFGRVVGDMAIGRPLDQALLRLAERTRLTEYAFLAVTLGLQAQTGGSLAETLGNLADTVRRRVALNKRAAALAAEARMQAGILAVLPFVSALAMASIQPFYVQTFTEHPIGRQMAVIGFVLLIFGLLTIRWMIRRAGTG